MMSSQNVIVTQKHTPRFGRVFKEWLLERKEVIIPFYVLFVVVDPLMTWVGTDAFNISEGNFIVSTLVKAENGWIIWLALKTLFGFVGTMFMFSSYYVIHAGKLTEIEKQKATVFEYGAWSFIIGFLFIIILHWAYTITLT